MSNLNCRKISSDLSCKRICFMKNVNLQKISREVAETCFNFKLRFLQLHKKMKDFLARKRLVKGGTLFSDF